MSALVSKHLSFCVEEMLAEVDAALTEHTLVKALAQLDQREARGEALDAICGQALRTKLESEIEQLPMLRIWDKIKELQELVAEAGVGAACQPRAAEPSASQWTGEQPYVERPRADAIDAFLDAFDLSDEYNAQAKESACAQEFVGGQNVGGSLDRSMPQSAANLADAPDAAALAASTTTARVVDLGAYRAQSREAPTEPEPALAAKPKLRIRVQAGTSQALALSSMALVCWISVPPLSVVPAPLRAVEIAVEQVVGLLPFSSRLMAMGGALLG